MIRPRVDHKVADEARRKYRPGTENGDASIGVCALPSCQARVARSDNFIVTLAGHVYHTRCWPQVMIKRIFTNPDGTLKDRFKQR